MPLLPTTLATALIELDEPEPPRTAATTADAWFEAWWAYAKDMSFWTPGVPEATKELARPVFVALLLPACVPGPVPGVFFLALEAAMIAGWATASAAPGSLLPAYSPVPIVPPPVPGTLATALGLTVVVGLASPTKEPVRVAYAAAIDTWTRLFTALLASPPPPPAPPGAPLL